MRDTWTGALLQPLLDSAAAHDHPTLAAPNFCREPLYGTERLFGTVKTVARFCAQALQHRVGLRQTRKILRAPLFVQYFEGETMNSDNAVEHSLRTAIPSTNPAVIVGALRPRAHGCQSRKTVRIHVANDVPPSVLCQAGRVLSPNMRFDLDDVDGPTTRIQSFRHQSPEVRIPPFGTAVASSIEAVD
jgi:hypothetical protein